MKFSSFFIRWALERRPDFIIGGVEDPYLLRWWVIPRNPIFNVYIHLFLRSDDDRALHDHPWMNVSILLDGSYREHLADRVVERRAGAVVFRLSGKTSHRIELHQGPCWTLFLTGPRYREWGFHCLRGWVPWQQFTDSRDKGSIGRGCE